MNNSDRIFGIVPPMTTPFRPDDTIDEAALRAEARFMVETARVHGLAVTGSTGEGSCSPICCCGWATMPGS
jgi:4-hydroxy-tetrahydrodipicolinate synthase